MAENTSSAPRTDTSDNVRTPRNPGYQLAARAVDAMAEKKAQEVMVIDLREVSSLADFFVLGTGESDLQVRAIVRSVEDHIEETCEELPWKKEGLDHLQWAVLDYVDVVVHVFSPEQRDHYDLERLWGDATLETVPPEGDATDVELLQELIDETAQAQ